MKSSKTETDHSLDHADWWYSADGMRGFNWKAVVGYSFKKGGQSMGYAISTLYLFTVSGIMNFSGTEAESLYEQVKTKIKELQ